MLTDDMVLILLHSVCTVSCQANCIKIKVKDHTSQTQQSLTVFIKELYYYIILYYIILYYIILYYIILYYE